MKTTTSGIDLAKTVFQIHGMADHGKPVLRKRLDRSKMLEFVVKLPRVTKWLKPSGNACRKYGDSVSVRAVTRVNVEKASKKYDA